MSPPSVSAGSSDASVSTATWRASAEPAARHPMVGIACSPGVRYRAVPACRSRTNTLGHGTGYGPVSEPMLHSPVLSVVRFAAKEVKTTRPPSGKIVGTNESAVEAAPVAPSAQLTRVVVPLCRSLTKMSEHGVGSVHTCGQESPSSLLRLVAVEANATYRAFAEIDGSVESASAPTPAALSARLTSVVVAVCRSRTNTLVTASLSSALRLSAWETNATNRPSAEMTESVLWPFAGAPVGPLARLTSGVSFAAACAGAARPMVTATATVRLPTPRHALPRGPLVCMAVTLGGGAPRHNVAQPQC